MPLRGTWCAVVVVVATACGRSSEHRSALEKYVNDDMKLAWAELEQLQRPLDTLPTVGSDPWIGNAMRRQVLPRSTRFLELAGRVVPPAPVARLHATIVEIVRELQAISTEILAAHGLRDENGGVRYHAARDRYKAVASRRRQWTHELDTVLAEHGVTFRRDEVPELTLLEPSAPPGPCGEAPCPCTHGSEVRAGPRLVSCTFAKPVTIAGVPCTAAKVDFHPSGSIARCTRDADAWFDAGEAVFHPNGKPARGVLRNYDTAHARYLCGPGPVRKFEDESYERCTVHGQATLAGIAIPKSRSAFVVFHRGGAPRYVAFAGKQYCFDPAGQPVTPCAEPP